MIGEYLRNEAAGGALPRFTRDLTADARAERLEPVRCRENEVSRVIDILLRHGKNNPALERRFQKVVVRELGELETLEILVARKERLERHHNVLISDEALRAAVKLTDVHVMDRMRPDKAIDALDEACAHLQAIIEYSS